MSTLCRSCGAAVRWEITAATGRRIPLDVEPSPAGNVWLDDAGLAHVMSSAGQLPLGAVKSQLYVPHHATCPQGREWKAKR